jgi:hypothetical protein
MYRNENDPSDHLLEWHLDLLDGDAARWIESELQRDAKLREQSQKLENVLRPLDHWSVHHEPPNLAENILSSVRQARTHEDRTERRGRVFAFPLFRIRDLGAVAACIALLMGVFVPGASALRSRSQRILCASNMHSIGQGLSQYQASFAGSLPFAGFAADSAWLPGSDPTCFSSNSRHVFLLYKHGFVAKPNVFLCPSNKNAAPMKVAALGGCDDFNEGNNISYDSHNLAGATPNLRPLATIAYLADPNPLFIGGRFNDDIDPQIANSPAHGGRGQTVLLLDGRVEYMRTPVYGDHKDNVWTIEGVRHYKGIETPTRLNDSFLVPGVPKIHR